MLFTTHTIVGAAIGVATKNPALGFAAGFLTHHIMDSLPHFDQGSYRAIKSGPNYLNTKIDNVPEFSYIKRDWIMLLIDFALGGTLFLSLLALLPIDVWFYLIIGALGCLMPDIIDSSPLWSKKLRTKYKLITKYHKFHKFFHWTVKKNQAFLGATTQISLIIISLAYLLK
ncbi:MAG: hypothetical protein Q8L47_03000 [bacterium]|nr:hypothetical protein [bacterium]